MAHRLSEDANKSVLLLEYGGSDAWSPSSLFIHMPTALSIPMNMSKYDWGFKSVAEPGLAGRSLACPRGKVLGGSSSINGMAYVRFAPYPPTPSLPCQRALALGYTLGPRVNTRFHLEGMTTQYWVSKGSHTDQFCVGHIINFSKCFVGPSGRMHSFTRSFNK